MSIIISTSTNHQFIKGLQSGKNAVLRTDTVYGIVTSAANEAAVNQIFAIKQRDTNKPLIVLVASVDEIPGLTENARLIYDEFSARQPTSIIIPETNQPSWLTRRQGSVAYRVPSTRPELLELIQVVGPLVAPSANPQSLPTARTIDEAVHYFGDSVDFYVDGGEVPKEISPSRLIRPDGDRVEVLR